MICEEMECGVFDIEVVKQVNVDLIGMIEESLQIVDEGKVKCVEVEEELKKMEFELCEIFVMVKVKKIGLGDMVGIFVG